MNEPEAAIKKIMEILKSHEIVMDIHGCGCCGSPDVKFIYKGETIIDDSDVNFNMSEEKECL